MLIKQVDSKVASVICRKITADLPEYFGLPDANESYFKEVEAGINIAAEVGGKYVGLLSLTFPYPKSASIYWMGILKRFHNKGIGKSLFVASEKIVRSKGAEFITVETLSLSENDDNYAKTYNFYKSLGFTPMFDLQPANYEYNMVYMIKKLDNN